MSNRPDDRRAYLWHLNNARWEAAMETVEDDGDAITPPKTFKGVHEKFLRERGHKARRDATRKNLESDSRQKTRRKQK